ncbi:hypothetical protein RF11_01580 [Thelohanellus kitauei]|uniref:Uncharacterized protein n=1 Tax=Thelohanellus kitauei TaxID=669202 RepID=A0A0C2IYA2_THEKT|nr:hypothetical protein RF11_01580 [Thelohanellus kitauei]
MDFGDEVLIGAFDLELVIGPEKSHSLYHIGYLYKFRKDTTYEFSKYQLHFKIYANGFKYIEMTFTSLIIKFTDSTQSCESKNFDLEFVPGEFNKDILVTPCKSVDEKWTFEQYNLESLTNQLRQLNEEKKKEEMAEEETEKEETEEEKAEEEKTEEEVRRQKIILIVCIRAALVLISVLGIIFILWLVKFRKPHAV